MPNLLDGIQFRELTSEVNAWTTSPVRIQYSDWQDAGDNDSFAIGTQFRLKPVVEYELHDETGKTILHTADKNVAMARIAKLLDEDQEILVIPLERAQGSVGSFLMENKIQYKLDMEGTWTNGTYFNTSGYGSRVNFRKRPDYFWKINIHNGIAMSELTFDDVNDVDKYVSHQLRTSNNNINIMKVAYGTAF